MTNAIEIIPPDRKTRSTLLAGISEWQEVAAEEEVIRTSLLGPTLTALAMLVLGVGGFFTWAAYTDIAQASMASAKVIVESNTKTVTHLEGGTLEALIVSEGQKIKQGDLLATLETTRSKSAVAQLHQKLYVLATRLSRLIAERDEKNEFVFVEGAPPGIDKKAALQWLNTEQKLFRERRSQFQTQIESDQSMIDQLRSENAALIARRNSWVEQAEIIKREYELAVALRAKQLATKTRVSEMKLQLVDMSTRIAESDAAIAQNKQKENQANLNLVNRRTDYFRLISEQIQAAQADSARITQEAIASEDVVKKSAIRSPQDGIVANIRIRTPGSAVIAGQPLLDIVPAHQPMLLEGKARPQDIDTIRIGEKVEVRLSSFGASEEFPLIGSVVYIAPDSIPDEKTGEQIYLFRAKINAGELEKQPNIFLYPGMTASVNIVNGNRTALTFLIQPFMQSFSRAFREK